ncbi:MAG: SurA N-terminal domain-containing protein [Chlamydiales bacterium]
MKTTLLFVSIACALAAAPFGEYSSEPKIAVQNAILAQVNGKTISMIDVKKKMDMVFYQSYPHLANSNEARLQFYEASWRRVLMDLIDNELIIADALDKEIKLTDGEIRESMEERFGPNVMQTLDKVGLTYEETWKMVKDEMMVQRMTWWFVQTKAINNVTPQDIRQAYRLHLEQHPPYSEWKYRVVSIRLDQPNDPLSEKVYQILTGSGEAPAVAESQLKELEAPGVAISISNEFIAKTQELSEIHRASLESLTAGSYSKPSFQISKADQKAVYRIFYLIEKNDFPAPSFEDLSQNLRNDLLQKALVQESEGYLGKLRKHYGFETDQAIPEDFHPFSLQ